MAQVQLDCVARWLQCLPCLEMELEKKKMEEGVGRIYAENVSTWAATVGLAGNMQIGARPRPPSVDSGAAHQMAGQLSGSAVFSTPG